MAWGLGLEPRFSDSKSDVLPIRRPPNTEQEMAWGPGVEPGFSDSESDVLPIRRSPKAKSPSRSCLLRLLSRRQTTACLPLCEGGLHGLLLADLHLKLG